VSTDPTQLPRSDIVTTRPIAFIVFHIVHPVFRGGRTQMLQIFRSAISSALLSTSPSGHHVRPPGDGSRVWVFVFARCCNVMQMQCDIEGLQALAGKLALGSTSPLMRSWTLASSCRGLALLMKLGGAVEEKRLRRGRARRTRRARRTSRLRAWPGPARGRPVGFWGAALLGLRFKKQHFFLQAGASY
jgi:hypothetical protein